MKAYTFLKASTDLADAFIYFQDTPPDQLVVKIFE